jgi:hypothetical protein
MYLTATRTLRPTVRRFPFAGEAALQVHATNANRINALVASLDADMRRLASLRRDMTAAATAGVVVGELSPV